MAKTNADENLRDVIGNYVIQLVQLQTAVNQLQEQLAAKQQELDVLLSNNKSNSQNSDQGTPA